MIKVVLNDKTITVNNVRELDQYLEIMFREDPNPDVTLTYVISQQPTSRRMTSKPDA